MYSIRGAVILPLYLNLECISECVNQVSFHLVTESCHPIYALGNYVCRPFYWLQSAIIVSCASAGVVNILHIHPISEL